MNKQPDQMLYDELFKRSKLLGLDTYTFLPEEGTPYPFVVIGDTQLLPRPTKSYLLGRVSATVHVWSTAEDRKWLSDTIGNLSHEFGKIGVIDNLKWNMDFNSSSQIMKDDTTDEMLWHGIMDLSFQFTFNGGNI